MAHPEMVALRGAGRIRGHGGTDVLDEWPPAALNGCRTLDPPGVVARLRGS